MAPSPESMTAYAAVPMNDVDIVVYSSPCANFSSRVAGVKKSSKSPPCRRNPECHFRRKICGLMAICIGLVGSVVLFAGTCDHSKQNKSSVKWSEANKLGVLHHQDHHHGGHSHAGGEGWHYHEGEGWHHHDHPHHWGKHGDHQHHGPPRMRGSHSGSKDHHHFDPMHKNWHKAGKWFKNKFGSSSSSSSSDSTSSDSSDSKSMMKEEIIEVEEEIADIEEEVVELKEEVEEIKQASEPEEAKYEENEDVEEEESQEEVLEDTEEEEEEAVEDEETQNEVADIEEEESQEDNEDVIEEEEEEVVEDEETSSSTTTSFTGVSSCETNIKCAKLGLQGDCCPTDAGIMLGCCPKY